MGSVYILVNPLLLEHLYVDSQITVVLVQGQYLLVSFFGMALRACFKAYSVGLLLVTAALVTIVPFSEHFTSLNYFKNIVCSTYTLTHFFAGHLCVTAVLFFKRLPLDFKSWFQISEHLLVKVFPARSLASSFVGRFS